MLKNYLKIAFKVLGRRKFFTFASLFGVSLTLTVLMVATAMLDYTFAPRAPEIRLDRTLGVFVLSLSGPQSSLSGPPGYAFLDRTVRDLPGAELVSIFQVDFTAQSFIEGRRVDSQLKRTDSAFWKIMDFDFAEGGAFTDDDERNANNVAVINETTRRRFFGDGEALGRRITTDDQTFQVVGVVRDVPQSRTVPFGDIWVPLTTNPSSNYRLEFLSDFQALVLARSKRELPALQAEFKARVDAVESPDPKEFPEVSAEAETVLEYRARQFLNRRTGEVSEARLRGGLLLAALIFMVLPAVNLMNINLSRILERSSEIGARKAFGASPGLLLGQFIVENLVLTLLGGFMGAVLSAVVLAALNRSGLVPYSHFGLNLKVFLTGLALAGVFALLSGIVPAWRMARLHPVEALGRS